MSYYIPACVVSIGIRFDDRFHVQKEPPRPKPGSLDEFLQDSGSDPLPDYGLRPTPEPLVTGAIGDELSWFANVIPTKVSVDLDGYHKASKWSVTIKWRDMPVMPVLIKAGQVRIFLGTINPGDFAAGMLEPLTRDKLTNAQLHVYDEAGQPDMDKLVIWGAFDEAEVTFNEKTNEFTIEGRDLRGIFLDSPIDEKTITTINLDQPIDKVVRDILSLHPLARNMRIQVQPSDWDTEELPHPAAKNNVTRVSKKANGKGSPSSHPPGANSKMNYWDLCVQYCFLVGAVPYFHGDILIIRPVTALYKLLDAENSQDGFDPNVKTPFLNNQPRRVDGYDFSVRKLVYGRNIEQIKWKRKYLGSERPRIIEVVSLDTSADKRGKSKLITAMWPKDIAKKALAAKNKGKTPGTVTGPTGLTASEVRRIPIYGINSKEQLERIAQGIFEANARMEIVGEFSTKELASLMAAPDYGSADATEPWPNDDADLLKLRVGHPVEFLMDIANTGSRRVGDSPIVDEMQRLEGLGFDEAVEEVARRIQVTRPDGSADKDYNLARALVATARNAIVELQTIYRVNKVKFNYDNGKVQISGSVHNYIEVEYGDNSRKTERKPRKIQKQSVAQAGPTSMELDKKYAQERAAYKAELERQSNPSLDDIIERYKKR